VTGKLQEGTTATDLVLTVTQMLRQKGVVGKFVEFFGPGLSNLTVEDRATIGNMAPEYGATCGLFPIEDDTITYLLATGRDPHRVALVEAYAKAQGMWRTDDSPDPWFSDTLELDLGSVVPSLAGPKRPQDRVALSDAAREFRRSIAEIRGEPARTSGSADSKAGQAELKSAPVAGTDYRLSDGHVVIAAITSCTNTSNPSVLIGAGLLAKKAHESGLKPKPWVKTSLAPGSQVVTEYLEKSGLQAHLDALGFNLVGYGCTTCIGNSGPLADPISEAINKNDLIACSVLSGNRNFEGRVNPDVRANYLASPPLVVAYALAGTLTLDVTREPLASDPHGNPVYLRDLWPSSAEIASVIRRTINEEMFRKRYGDVFKGDEHWRKTPVEGGLTYRWSDSSTYVQNPPYFADMSRSPEPPTDIVGARILGLFLDSITTDHISPAGAIKRDGPAGAYLMSRDVRPVDFNSYGARRGNHQVMMRGTFANIRIKNQMAPGVEGGVTIHYPSGERMWIYDAAMRYAQEGTPLVIFAGREYGTGSSRDWAAKGTRLLGVRAIIAQSFERIHRSNLVGMGVLPLVLEEGTSWQSLGLRGDETVTIRGIRELRPRQVTTAEIRFPDGARREIRLLLRIDTLDELEYYRNGGILPYVLRNLVKEAA
jgi:aconitate hydratase